MLAVVSTVVMLLLISVMEPVSCSDITANCPDLTSLPADCSCRVTTTDDPTHFIPSGNFLTIACGDPTGATPGTMTDGDVTNLVTTVIQPTTPVEAIGIYYQPSVTQVPTGLSQITNLKAVSMFGNAITAVNAADLTWTGLQEINLNANAITSITGDFVLTSTAETDGSGITRIDLSGNQQIPSLSSATFSLTGDSVYLSFSKNAISSVNAAVFTLTATQSITLDLQFNSISSLSGTFNLVATDGTNDGSAVELLVGNNQLTTLSPATFNLNGGAGGVSFSFPSNQLASISTDDQIILQSTKKISIELQDNQLTSLALASDTNPQPLTERQELIVLKNLLTSINCNDLGINSGVAEFFLDAKNNQITDVICGADTPLNSAQKVILDFSLNSINAISEGALNFAGQVSAFLALNNQTSPGLNSIAQGSLPSNYADGSYIDLSANDLTSLDQGVFETILQSFSAGNFNPTFTYIDASSNPNLDCGSPSGDQCGSERWLFSDATLLPFVKGTCQNGNEFSSYTNEVCLCPPTTDLGGCTCALTTGSDTTVTISCADQQLDDTAVETLVDKIAWAPIDTFDLSGNLLTKIPANLAPQLASVTTLSLTSNSITSIGSGELNLQATVVSLDVSSNSISTIAADALPVNYASGSTINLSGNSLTSLDQGVLEPILRSFADGSFDAATTFIDASLNPNLDCGLPSGDQCGSERWLFSDATLLPFVKGTCQNGNEFSTYTNEICLCPPATDLGTCTCALSTDSTTTVTVNCADQQLDDSTVETLVNKISWAPIDTFDLSGNKMTKIPSGLSALVQLSSLSVGTNQITSIGAADLSSLAAAVKQLNFASNSISTVDAGSFPAQFASGAQIFFNANPLTALTQDAFEPVIKNFISNGYSNSDTFISLIDTNQFDCDASTCGSESWLITNEEYKGFIQGDPQCSDGTVLKDIAATICWCPPSASTATCSCDLTAGSTTAITVNCTSQGLGDAAMESVLLSISVTSPLDTLLLDGNNLTKVPSSSSRRMSGIVGSRASTSLLTRFPLLNYLSLASNAITSILKGDLTLTAPLKFLDLSSNQISRVAVGSLPSSYENGAQILLDDNKLTGLDATVFQPILDYFVKNGYPASSTFISLSNNPINCNTDTPSSSSVCYDNVGWLINSNSLASFVQKGTCADGKSISAVNKASCSQTQPTTTTTTTTRRPFKRKPFLEILAHSWVQSVLNSIFSSRPN